MSSLLMPFEPDPAFLRPLLDGIPAIAKLVTLGTTDVRLYQARKLSRAPTNAATATVWAYLCRYPLRTRST